MHFTKKNIVPYSLNKLNVRSCKLFTHSWMSGSKLWLVVMSQLLGFKLNLEQLRVKPEDSIYAVHFVFTNLSL